MKVPKPPRTRPPRAARSSTLRKKLMRDLGVPVIRKGKALLKHGGDRRR